MSAGKQFEILVVGRVSGDVIPREKIRIDVVNKGLDIYGENHSEENNRHFHISTDSTPSKENDKVNSLIDLSDFVDKYSYIFRWGGGAINSALALSELRVPVSQMGVTVLSPAKGYLNIGTKTMDLTDFLDANNIGNETLDRIKPNFNIILSSKEDKIVVRNKSLGKEDFTLNREKLNNILGYIRSSDGILINALNNSAMTKFIVETVFWENQSFYNNAKFQDNLNIEQIMSGPERFFRFKHRKIMTVVTHSPAMQRKFFIDHVLPYTGLILNREDTINIFYGHEKEIKEKLYREMADAGDDKEKKYGPLLKVMSQIRFGIPTDHGAMRCIEETGNNIYITLGKEGHLVCIGNEAYHLKVKKDKVDDINVKIFQNKSSVNGAGDAFAGAVTYAETIGVGRDYRKTAAIANTAVFRYLGVNQEVIPSEIEVSGPFNLNNLRSDETLYNTYRTNK